MGDIKCVHSVNQKTPREVNIWATWEDYFKVDVKEMVCDNVDWLQPA